MSWKVRHEGSPIAVDGLTLAQVVEGLQDGRWEPTDEVLAPGDADWTPIENHAELAEVAADLEPPPSRTYDDETRLDMTALIDVTLVLLIFFILTTSYAALQKIVDAPPAVESDAQKKLPEISRERVKEQMVHVQVAMENDRPVIRIEGQEVGPDDLLTVLSGLTGGDRRKTELLLEADPQVPREILVTVQDRAKGAGVRKVYRLLPRPGAGGS